MLLFLCYMWPGSSNSLSTKSLKINPEIIFRTVSWRHTRKITRSVYTVIIFKTKSHIVSPAIICLTLNCLNGPRGLWWKPNCRESIKYWRDRVLLATKNSDCQGRGIVRCVKRIRGRRGKPDTIEYLVNIDLVSQSPSWTISTDNVNVYRRSTRLIKNNWRTAENCSLCLTRWDK